MTARKPTPRPTSLKVGHLDFDILWLDEEEWKAHPDVEEDKAGHMAGWQSLIIVRVQSKISESNLREILLHEVVHAAFYVCGLWNEPVHRHDDVEEAFIMRTAPVMLQVFRDNPDFVKYLTG